MVSVCHELRKTYKRIGAVGFCYGGWAVFRLGGAGLLDCISTAHPSLLEKSEIDEIRVPVQIMAPEKDDMYTEELKAHSLDVIPKLGIPFDWQYFPGLEHAFAVRGNPDDVEEQKGMERAKDCVVSWLRQWLHEKKSVD